MLYSQTKLIQIIIIFSKPFQSKFNFLLIETVLLAQLLYSPLGSARGRLNFISLFDAPFTRQTVSLHAEHDRFGPNEESITR